MHDSILLIDDDSLLRRGLAVSLQRHGFHVLTAGDAEDGLALAQQHRPDLVLLDIGLPGMDGLDALPIFQQKLHLPVILLTARRRAEDEALGLDLGADDYVTKPFDLERLLARINAVLRRSRRAANTKLTQLLTAGSLAIDPAGRQAYIGNVSLDLTPKEFDLLAALAARAGQVQPAETLLANVWGADYSGEPQVLYVTISKLREKLAAVPNHNLRIVTRHRLGYKLVEEA